MSDPTATSESPFPAGEAEAVLARAGQIAKAGLPLAAGLRAAADEAGPLQPVDHSGRGPGRQAGMRRQPAGGRFSGEV